MLPYRRKLDFDLRQRARELLESVGLVTHDPQIAETADRRIHLEQLSHVGS